MKTIIRISTILSVLVVSSVLSQERTEIIEKRTSHSKTYQKSDTSYVMEFSQTTLHYKDKDGKYKDIKTSFETDRTDAEKFAVYEGHYQAFIDPNSKTGKTVRFKTKDNLGLDFEIKSLGYYDKSIKEYKVIEQAEDVKAEIKDNVALYKNIFKGVDIQYTYLEDRLKEDIIVSDKARKELPDPKKLDLNPDSTFLMVQFVMDQDVGLTRMQKETFNAEGGWNTDKNFETFNDIAFNDVNGNKQFSIPADLAGFKPAQKDIDPLEYVEQPVFKRLYKEGEIQYLLSGVAFSWLEELPDGEVIIDPSIDLSGGTNNPDAFVINCTYPGHGDESNINYGSSTAILAYCWTHSGSRRDYQFFIKFDIMASLPTDAHVINATLQLKNDGYKHSGDDVSRYDDASTYIRRVTESWVENTITWRYQPSATQTNQVAINPPISGTQALTADVTTLVNDILDSDSNNGFQILQQEQIYWRGVRYASREHPTSSLRPKLTIEYVESDIVYYLKDHLGNIRVTIDENGTVVTADDYYPFGMQMPGRSYNVAFSGNQYKYNGKELDDENGLDWYNYGARMYDPEIARWMVIDPFADKYPSFNPYNYTLNNPINLVDPNGREPNKSQATSPRQLINYLQRVYKNNANETLAYLGDYSTLGGSNPNHKRYIYTKVGGWIDLVHFFNVVTNINQLSGLEKMAAYTTMGEAALWNKTVEVEERQVKNGDIGTAWSYEDAPSNYLGYMFWKYYYDPDGDLIEQIIKFLKDFKATDPDNAPNWEEMWQKENPYKQQYQQNKSFNPRFTSDNDSNNDEDDWWSDYDPSKH